MSKGNPTALALEHLIPAFTHTNQLLEKVQDELVSIRGIPRRGAEARPVINGVSQRRSTSPGQLAGYAFRETSGAAPAVIRLWDGVDTSGDLIFTLALPQATSSSQWFLPHGIAFVTGLYVEVVSGAVEGVVHIGPFGS